MKEKIKALYVKYKEIILYVIFGVVTTLVNWIVYAIMTRALHVDLTAVGETQDFTEMFTGEAGNSLTALFICNLIAWVAGVLVAFITNKIWVFESHVKTFKGVAKEFILFVGARIASGIFEWFGPSLCVMIGINQKIFGIEGFLAKIIVSFIVIMLNYILSKLIVFRKNKQS